MAKVTIEGLLETLRAKKKDAQLQKETNQVYMILKHEKREFPLFVRIMGEGELVQLMVFFPVALKPTAYPDLARLLHVLNKEIDIPGFGMDEKAKVAFYRCMIPTLDGEMPETFLDGFLRSIEVVCQTFSPVIEAVGFGVATYAELMKKAEEQMGKGGPPLSPQQRA